MSAPYIKAMNKTQRFAASLGIFATAHYGMSAFFYIHEGGPDAPPLGSVITSVSTSSVSVVNSGIIMNTRFDAITDAEYGITLHVPRPLTPRST